MNIFQIIPSVVFVENEQDLEFVEKLKKAGIVDSNNFKIQTKKQYVVKPLDTILSVAKKLDISPEKVMESAGSNNLFVGQVLKF